MARSRTDTTANAANGSVTVRERVARMDKIGKTITRKCASASSKLYQAAHEIRKSRSA